MKDERFNDRGFAIAPVIVRVYNYDSVTFEYLNSVEEYLHTGVGLPAFSCLDAPPKALDGYAVCRSEENQSWIQVIDYRGKLAYHKVTHQEVIVDILGELPDDYTFLKPEGVWSTWDAEKKAWNDDRRPYYSAVAKAQKAQILAQVSQVTSNWNTQLLLGIIEDKARADLITWQRFAQQVEAISTDVTEEIKWPTPPEIS